MSDLANKVVETLVESDDVDPKDYAHEIPSVYTEAITWAKEQFDMLWAEGAIKGPRQADEKMSELAYDACAQFELEGEEDEEILLTELYKYSAELVKGVW